MLAPAFMDVRRAALARAGPAQPKRSFPSPWATAAFPASPTLSDAGEALGPRIPGIRGCRWAVDARP
jgi:hypothetical protein